MFPIPLATSCNEIPTDKFWNAVLVYHDRPHILNRRLIGAVPVLFLKVDFNNPGIKRLSEVFTRSAILYELRQLKGITKESITKALVRNILETFDKAVCLEEVPIGNFLASEDGIYVSVRILLARHHRNKNCVEVVVLDKRSRVATFYTVSELDKVALAPTFPYDVELVGDGNLRVCVSKFEDAESASAEWLSDELFPKLLKWAENFDPAIRIHESLSLVSIETYTKLYHSLKVKYGDKVVKIWPERTDPSKFVYEDVAIAAYLISLWETTNPANKPSFVDLGCGNGLLVYILNEEGFPGYGIDVRKRKIWDWYPKTTTLKVETIVPSASFLFPQTDWVIGNHSDELTPWVPVIAARSSLKTNFFLLPCCCYDFSGQKYKRVNSSVSVYTEYLEYIHDLCKKCGFVAKIDRLRIPSTRRTCIVSFGRTYLPDFFNQIDQGIGELFEQTCGQFNDNLDKSGWVSNFQARPNTERVRNCTQLDKAFIEELVGKIVKLLLREEVLQAKSTGEMWNAGGKIMLQNIVEEVPKEDLARLKSECGGLQTLLRNHRYIFETVKGSVRLRIPATAKATCDKYEGKPCWFHANHPDGCLRQSGICAYKHM